MELQKFKQKFITDGCDLGSLLSINRSDVFDVLRDYAHSLGCVMTFPDLASKLAQVPAPEVETMCLAKDSMVYPMSGGVIALARAGWTVTATRPITPVLSPLDALEGMIKRFETQGMGQEVGCQEYANAVRTLNAGRKAAL